MKGRHFLVGPGVTCDVDALVNTRLVVQANSGAGKSWALRRILEQTHGHLQQLVVDPEGEFPSLREKFDYVLAARQGGDTLADPRSAKLLAERLLELGVSAIVDVYELKAHERLRFVRLFLEALVDAPKKLWHPVLVVLDEAHVYCPQQGEAESAGPVIDLCTRGRKRGYCAVLATQRLSKLHKDAAAECNNKLIGRSALDVDMDRAGDELGLKKGADRQVLRELEAGEFFAFGPALCRTVTRVKVGPVQTTHPKAGSRLAAVVPPPTEKVKAVLSKLSDLPAEAEAREKGVADLKRDVATLRRQLTETRRQAGQVPAPKTERIEVPVLKEGHVSRLEKLVGRLDELPARLSSMLAAALDPLSQQATAIRDMLKQVAATRQAVKAVVDGPRALASRPPTSVRRPAGDPEENGDLDGVSRRILATVAMLNTRGLTVSREAVARWMAIHPNGGRFNKALARLRRDGLLDGLVLTAGGASLAVPLDTGTDAALAALPDETKRRLLREVMDAGKPLSREDLAERLGIHPNGGRFNRDLAWLRTMGVIPDRGSINPTPGLFR